MKTKIWVGVLFYSFLGCANKAPKSNLTSKLDSTGEAVYFVEDTVVGGILQACKSLKP